MAKEESKKLQVDFQEILRIKMIEYVIRSIYFFLCKRNFLIEI